MLPHLAVQLAKHPRTTKVDFTGVRSCISGGAVMGRELQRKIRSLIHVPIIQGRTQ